MATYYMRADGTAANKGAATGPSSTVGACMNMAVHNGETFSADDVIIMSSKGGNFTSALWPPSSGSDGHQIIYQNETAETPIIGTTASITGWDTAGNWTNPSGNIWYITWASNPKRLWLSGTEAAKAETSTVTSAEKWYWDDPADRLYVYSTSNPASAFTSMTYPGLIYAVVISEAAPKHYITFDGIETRLCRNYNYYLRGCDGIIIKNCTVGRDSGGMGVHVQRAEGVKDTCLNGQIYDCTFNTNYTLTNTWRWEDDIEDGININDGCSGWLIHGNTITNWGHTGVYLINLNGTYPITNNKVYQNVITAPNIIYGRGISADSVSSSSTGNEMYRNYIYDTPIKNQFNCYGLKVYYNVFNKIRGGAWSGAPGTAGDGVSLEGYSSCLAQNMEFYNNVIYNAAQYGLAIYDGGTDKSGNIFKNNIIAGCGGVATDYQFYMQDGPTVLDNTYQNNLFYKSGATDVIYYGHDTVDDYPHTVAEFNAENGTASDVIGSNIGSDPLFVNGTGGYTAAIDFRLQAGSPCRNVGASVGLTQDYEGSTVPR